MEITLYTTSTIYGPNMVNMSIGAVNRVINMVNMYQIIS